MTDVDLKYVGAHEGVRKLLEYIGENPEREGLVDTPSRVLKAYSEMLSGYSVDIADILKTTFQDGIDYDQMIVVKDIPFISYCEHHMLPFPGVAHVGYLPNNRVVGLSKIPRIVDAFSKRLQVQERLTDQVADAIYDYLDPVGVGVIVQATHTCMTMRGVKKPGASMVTTALRGSFMEAEQRQEFYNMVKA